MKAKLFVGVALACVFATGHAPAPAADTASIYETLAGLKEFTTLCVAIKEAEEIATLKAQGQQYTLLAPTDDAFKKLDDAAIKKLATDKAAVKQLIRAHLVMGKLTVAELKKLDGKEIQTLQGNRLKVEETKDGFRIGGVKVVTANIQCNNGVIHTVDTVLPFAKE